MEAIPTAGMGEYRPCPVSCGACCKGVTGSWGLPLRDDGYCKLWTSSGCSLPPGERPFICRHFVCGKGTKEER